MTGGDGIAQVPAPSGTVSFLFSDIEGSTQRWDRDRGAMQEALRLHDRIMRSAIAAHDGHVFKTMGDAFFAAFSTPESAAAAALDAQRALGASDFSAVDGLSVRMAINTGTADERDGDYFGPAVNRVARLLALGHGGPDLAVGQSPPIWWASIRRRKRRSPTWVPTRLKTSNGREHVYQLVASGLQRDFPALRAALHGPWLVPDAMRTRYFTGREMCWRGFGSKCWSATERRSADWGAWAKLKPRSSTQCGIAPSIRAASFGSTPRRRADSTVASSRLPRRCAWPLPNRTITSKSSKPCWSGSTEPPTGC